MDRKKYKDITIKISLSSDKHPQEGDLDLTNKVTQELISDIDNVINKRLKKYRNNLFKKDFINLDAVSIEVFPK